MTHEHLLINFSSMLNPAPNATAQKLANEPLSMANLGWIMQNPYSKGMENLAEDYCARTISKAKSQLCSDPEVERGEDPPRPVLDWRVVTWGA